MNDATKGFLKFLSAAAAGVAIGTTYYVGTKVGSLENVPPNSPQDPPPQNPTGGDFDHACEILGLPKTGTFTRSELKAKHTEALTVFHPDRYTTPKEKERATIMCQWCGWALQTIENRMNPHWRT